MGYRIPCADEIEIFCHQLIEFDDGLYIAPSFTLTETGYMVDMWNGLCSCPMGRDGAPCKHQYAIWINNAHNARNFLPLLDKYERQKYAKIAYGESLPIEFYKGLHDSCFSSIEEQNEQRSDSDPVSCINAIVSTQHEVLQSELSSIVGNSVYEGLQEKVYKAVKEISAYLKEKIPIGENSLIEIIVNLSITNPKIPVSRLPSILFSVGKDTAIKRRSRGKTKIKVHPGSQRRRVSKIGSRQKQSPGRKLTLPVPVTRPIRPHNFAENVSNNERIPNKAKTATKAKTLRKRKEASA